MPTKLSPTTLVIIALAGLAVIGIIVAMENQSSSSPVSDPNATAAINAIAASNENAQTLQAQDQQEAITQGATLEQSILSANTQLGLAQLQSDLTKNSNAVQESENATNDETQLAEVQSTNATTLAEANANDTAQTAQAAIGGQAVQTAAAASEANTTTEANAQKSAANATANGNIFSSLIGGIASFL